MNKFSVILLLSAPLLSQACTFAPGYELFAPVVANFEAKRDGGRVALLPPPIVSGIGLTRGTESPGSNCRDAGTLSLDLTWPKSSVYKLSEIGFYFRVVGEGPPDFIFPLHPISGKIAGQRARFFFAWLDGHPSGQSPLNLDVEVFAVNKGLEIGASRRFRVSDRMR